jgi:hypothetical protein
MRACEHYSAKVTSAEPLSVVCREIESLGDRVSNRDDG